MHNDRRVGRIRADRPDVVRRGLRYRKELPQSERRHTPPTVSVPVLGNSGSSERRIFPFVESDGPGVIG
jgi:hypothetical protein